MYASAGAISFAQVTALVALSRKVDLKPGPGGARITPLRDLTGECAAILNDVVKAPWTASMIVLHPSQQIPAHRDPPIPGRRYHLPLVVNPGCWTFSAGSWQQLLPGVIYQMDPTEPHGAVNWGTEIRLHLILDTYDL